MKANQATHSVREMCRLLNVSKSGFYAWDRRPMSARARVDIGLTAKIHEIHRRSRGAYGAPNIHAELADEHGIRVGCKRVARLMRAAGLRGVMPQRFVTTTRASRRTNLSAMIWWNASSRPTGPISCGSPTSPTSRPGPGSCTWRSCSTSGRARSSAGASSRTCAPSSCLTR